MIKKAVLELKDLKWKGRFSTYIYNEPMRDKRIHDIMAYCTEHVPGASPMVSTNGDYFRSVEDIEKLFKVGVRQVLINVYSEWDGADISKRERGMLNAEKRYKQLHGWVESLPNIQWNGQVYNYAPHGSRIVRIEKKYGTSPEDAKLGGKFELQNRSGNIPWMQPASKTLEKMCVRPWRVLNVDWKGQAVLCCNDYHSTTAKGSLKTMTLEEMWNQEWFHVYRLFLQNKRRDIALCDTCDYGGGAYQHLVDRVTFGKKKDKELLAKRR